jgi:hypothetical protein
VILAIGFARVNPYPADDAVQWWYYWPYEDGWAFARGGSCRTLRQARRHLRDCHGIRERERNRFLRQPDAELLDDGSLRPFPRSPYAVYPQPR